MTKEQRLLLQTLLVAGAFTVTRSRQTPRSSSHPSYGPKGPKILHPDRIMTDPSVRRTVVGLLAGRIRCADRDIGAIAAIHHGATWLAPLVAEALAVPLVLTHWSTGVGTVTGHVPAGTPIWLVDADPDSDEDGRLERAADLLRSSRSLGAHVIGTALVVESDGSSREEMAKAYPRMAFETLLDIRAALQELANGAFPKQVDPLDARRMLRVLDATPSTSARQPRSQKI